jgi:6-pyruvoyl-tetrahydropterin synthase
VTIHEESTEEAGAQGTIFLSEITRVDCAVFDPSKGVFGQSWNVDVMLTGALGDNGFVYDFAQLKKLVRQVLKTSLDHALIMPINSQAVQFKGMEQSTGEKNEKSEYWLMRSRPSKAVPEHAWEYRGPTGSVFPTRSVAVNRQVLEQEVVRSLRHRLPQEIAQIHVALREEEADPTEAVFRYTHGIAGHDGMCQRLLHGHRSRIQIFVGDERRPDLEHYIARDVLGTNVHIATPAQFKSGNVAPGTRGKTREPVVLGYQGSQGRFEAVLPADRVFCVERETSIECIAQEVARLIKREEAAADKVKVICYEGVGKGAIAEIH